MKMSECSFLVKKLLRMSVTNGTEQAPTEKPRHFKTRHLFVFQHCQLYVLDILFSVTEE